METSETNKKRVRESEDLKKTSLCLNYDAEREFSITIYDEEFDPGSG